MAEIVEEIKPLPGEPVLDKQAFSGFTNPQLHNLLGAQNISTLVVAGLATSQCVNSTVRAASDLGYGIIQLYDAMADYDEQSHNAALISSVGACGANILSTHELISESQATF